jgi:ribokinase
VAALGDDGHGAKYLAQLQAEGVDTDHVRVEPSFPTGLALIEVSGGENRIIVVPGANATHTPAGVSHALAQVEPGDVVLFQLEIPLEAVFAGIRQVKAKGGLVLLDPAPAVPLPQKFLALVDYLTPNQSEALTISQTTPGGFQPDPLTAGRELLRLGAPNVIQKAGKSGAWLLQNGREKHFPALAVEVVDTVGAGDTFNAGLAAGLANGLPLEQAMVWATAAGSLSTTKAGAQSAMPTREALEIVLRQ